MVLAGVHAHRTRGETGAGARCPDGPARRRSTVIVPAYNEAAGIQATIRSLVATTYRGELEVLVVDDGSIDGTADLAASLGFPGVRVIRRPNGGKSAALNTGIAQASHEVLVMVDGDTVFEPATIGRLVRGLADPAIGAVSGNTKVGNRRRRDRPLAAHRVRHRLQPRPARLRTARLHGDRARRHRGVPAFGAGGAGRGQRRHPGRGHRPDDGAVPGRLAGGLRGERGRLDRGARRRSASCGSSATAGAAAPCRRCGSTGAPSSTAARSAAAACGYLALFHVLLPLLAPVVDLMAVYSMAVGDPLPVVAVWAGFVLVQVVIGWYALLLDGERASALWILPLQQFVYRQLMYLVVIHVAGDGAAGRAAALARQSAGRAPSTADPGEHAPTAAVQAGAQVRHHRAGDPEAAPPGRPPQAPATPRASASRPGSGEDRVDAPARERPAVAALGVAGRPGASRPPPPAARSGPPPPPAPRRSAAATVSTRRTISTACASRAPACRSRWKEATASRSPSASTTASAIERRSRPGNHRSRWCSACSTRTPGRTSIATPDSRAKHTCSSPVSRENDLPEPAFLRAQHVHGQRADHPRQRGAGVAQAVEVVGGDPDQGSRARSAAPATPAGRAEFGQPHVGDRAVAAAGQAFGEGLAGLVEPEVGRVGDAAAEDEAAGVEDGRQVGEPLPDPLGHGGEGLQRRPGRRPARRR